ncbi:MAG: glycosyltransferase family A protein [Prevotellaceae bacterium]|nr:glycosyltransferase family A protein [Prevotellaceae bacterium]
MKKNKDILVSVLCPVYNQQDYVEQCLKSVVSQQTDFSYEVIVNDDHSTDHTADVVRRYEIAYPSLVTAIYQASNQFSQGVDIIRDVLLPRARGKYIAICEGDDWWTSPLKLQHQVQLMEQYPDAGLCYTYFDKYSQARQETFPFHFHEHEGLDVYPYILASKCTIWYVTVMMNADLMRRAPRLDTRRYFTGDVFWYYWVTSRSRTLLLREKTAVYRVLDTSVSHFTRKRRKIDFFFLSSNTRLYFARHYPPGHPWLTAQVRKKSGVNIFKYALLHRDYALSRTTRIALLPLMSPKKTGYCLLHFACRSRCFFDRASRWYQQHVGA